MKQLLFIMLISFSLYAPAQITNDDALLLRTATNHPMQYFLSLPVGWNKEKQWPIVVIIESADKEYKKNALLFVKARKGMPFILIAPFNVNNSRQGRRDPAIFPYSEATWDYIDNIGDCTFNMEGITQIIKDVQEKYNGEAQYFITGFEAGAHTVWQFVFQHPEKLKAAAPVAGNYNSHSCMTASDFSTDTARIQLPIQGFSGSLDTLYGHTGLGYAQWKDALQAAVDHGYKNISATVVAGKKHVPLPEEVLSWFYLLWKR